MPITVPELTTERLRLRAYSECDIPDMVSYLSEWETVRYTSRIPHPYTIIDAKNYVAANQTLNHEGMGGFAIERRDDRQWIGAMSLERRDGDPSAEPELGYVLGRAFWGKRYAREAGKAVLDYAFTQLTLTSIMATIYPENGASEKVLASLAFEAGERVTVLSRGKVVVLIKYTLTRDSWRKATT